ncbi:GumC family protein [Cribrihabitans neustonicus]|uniref:GumC family protein n=1 Tax=Cribrihabitans neustonicus TaxID=1429085 RepID=UPI003B5B4BA3
MRNRHSALTPGYPVAPAARPPEPDMAIDIRALFATLWRGRWTILLITALAAALGVFFSSSIEPTYKASAKVMFDPQLREIAAGGGVSPAGEDGLENEIQVLRSTALLNRVVEELELHTYPEFNPALGEPELSEPHPLLDLLPAAMEPEPGFAAEIPDLERRIVALNVSQGLRLNPIPASRVIEISFISADPQTSAEVANAFAKQYIDDQLHVRLSTTQAATDFLTGRVDELRERVQKAEKAVAVAQSAQSLEAGQSLPITKQELEALISALSETKNEARAARADYQRLTAALQQQTDPGAVPEFRESAPMAALLARESELRVQQANLTGALPPEHPAFEDIGRALQLLKDRQAEEAARIVEIARTRWQSLERQIELIEAEKGVLDRKVLQQTQDELAIRQLEREAEASRTLYETRIRHLNEASEQVKLESADARILTLAEPPLAAFSEPKKYALTIAVLGGLVLSVVLVFLRERLNNTFRSAAEVMKVTGMEVLATMPAAGGTRPVEALRTFAAEPNSHIAEAVHGLRTNILLTRDAAPPKVVLFTSSYPGEGKSLLAALTALASFRINKRTIIVDCDLRRPKLYQLLGDAQDKQNLVSVLDGTTPLDKAVRKDPVTGLHVLAASGAQIRQDISSVDILSSPGFAKLIETLRSAYDLVVLDAPPALLAVDTKILGKYADSLVYVVKWNKTSRDAVLAGLRELEATGAPVAGVVLSMASNVKFTSYGLDQAAAAR